MDEHSDIQRRKLEHIDICLREEVGGLAEGPGFDGYRFRHLALPEIDFESVDTRTTFLGKPIRAPLLVSSMTGGTPEAGVINRRLAAAAQRRGWAMGLGSARAALEREAAAESFRVRKVAPDIPLLVNLGAVQLNLGYGPDECRRLLALTEADAVVLHLNGLQEVFQPEGDTGFAGLLDRIASLCERLEAPVGVKEVGWGIDGGTARRLFEAGVAFVDVAGAGGTSWSEVERRRGRDATRRLAAEAFRDWGIPTATCIREVREAAPGGIVIGSGGVQSGVDAAKALALGADMAGFGRALLAAAAESEAQVETQLERLEFELRAAMFGIGAADLAALRRTDRLMRV
ncbi:type 2 isopentenyl-diphosphate Delta-isomerase [Cohnella sp. REN36]|uniref:type 2 isopentenyl-diphosphate Delta-isomerase n=1 Tax=Cohnella sp. REN36 TaxID=2887347 RepID=UPI001D140429|nr:type 2 isopentenyl-diphosphate Delta-isomerase [Cohnella sp. REN36]